MIGPEVMAGWIEDLGQIGRLPPDDSGQDRGLWRRPYTDEDERALAWVRERAEAAGLRVRRDAAGNLIARLDGSDPAATVVATGSHLDTVRSGGKYDGALGVLAGLAALADLAERRGQPRRPLELLVFEGEEGNRFPGFIGSYAMIEGRTAADFDGLVDADGVTASAALRAVGLDPARLPEACRSDLGAFVELHIEQGAVLERTATERGIREADGGMVGIVTAIVGARQLRLTFTGAPGHAGTTPMAGRRDPLRGAAELVLAATDHVEAVGAPAVLTCGQFAPLPGAPNVIPARVDLTLDTRDTDGARLEATVARILELADGVATRRGLEVNCQTALEVVPQPMDPGLVATLRVAAEAEGVPYLEMVSGAGHDAMIVARACPAAMLFVPSHHGYSHRPDEYTPIEPIMAGVRVLTRALESLAY